MLSVHRWLETLPSPSDLQAQTASEMACVHVPNSSPRPQFLRIRHTFSTAPSERRKALKGPAQHLHPQDANAHCGTGFLNP